MAAHGFTKDGARRIVRAVRKSERQPTRSGATGREDVDATPRFWVELTGEGSGATAGLYSWKLVYPSPTAASGWTEPIPAVTGTTNAREANGATGLGTGKRYLATFIGYDSADGARYVFMASSDFHGMFAVATVTQDGTNKRWTYTMRRHAKTAAGYAGWTEVSPADEITARNYQEEDNGATGLMGNGVTLNASGVVAGTNYTVGAVPAARGVHRVYRVTVANGTVEFWFSAANPLSGACT